MRLTRRLYQRFRVLIHEAAKFGVVGLAGFVVSLGGADVLHFDLGVGKYKAVVVATVAATVVTFLGNRYWAFRHRERVGMGRETVLFFVFNAIGLAIQLACVAIVVDGAGLQGKVWYNLANLCGIGLGTLFRFWSYRKWVWRTQEPASGVPAAAITRLARPPGPRRRRWPGPSRSAWTKRPRCTAAAPRTTTGLRVTALAITALAITAPKGTALRATAAGPETTAAMKATVPGPGIMAVRATAPAPPALGTPLSSADDVLDTPPGAGQAPGWAERTRSIPRDSGAGLGGGRAGLAFAADWGAGLGGGWRALGFRCGEFSG